MNEFIFRIRPYSKRELAVLYFPEMKPEQAVRKLTGWVKLCRPLHEALTREDRRFERQRYLTAKEVRLIVEHLGEP